MSKNEKILKDLVEIQPMWNDSDLHITNFKISYTCLSCGQEMDDSDDHNNNPDLCKVLQVLKS